MKWLACTLDAGEVVFDSWVLCSLFLRLRTRTKDVTSPKPHFPQLCHGILTIPAYDITLVIV